MTRKFRKGYHSKPQRHYHAQSSNTSSHFGTMPVSPDLYKRPCPRKSRHIRKRYNCKNGYYANSNDEKLLTDEGLYTKNYRYGYQSQRSKQVPVHPRDKMTDKITVEQAIQFPSDHVLSPFERGIENENKNLNIRERIKLVFIPDANAAGRIPSFRERFMFIFKGHRISEYEDGDEQDRSQNGQILFYQDDSSIKHKTGTKSRAASLFNIMLRKAKSEHVGENESDTSNSNNRSSGSYQESPEADFSSSSSLDNKNANNYVYESNSYNFSNYNDGNITLLNKIISSVPLISTFLKPSKSNTSTQTQRGVSNGSYSIDSADDYSSQSTPNWITQPVHLNERSLNNPGTHGKLSNGKGYIPIVYNSRLPNLFPNLEHAQPAQEHASSNHELDSIKDVLKNMLHQAPGGQGIDDEPVSPRQLFNQCFYADTGNQNTHTNMPSVGPCWCEKNCTSPLKNYNHEVKSEPGVQNFMKNASNRFGHKPSGSCHRDGAHHDWPVTCNNNCNTCVPQQPQHLLNAMDDIYQSCRSLAESSCSCHSSVYSDCPCSDPPWLEDQFVQGACLRKVWSRSA